jgi:phage-related minor tail protein
LASKNIRGITIEIGGDTTKLGKALEGTEKQTRSLQTELKSVEKLLKFDPTNTDLLAQKQKLLADMVDETSSKLDILKSAQSQVAAQFERGEIGADQYRAFQREIIQTEQTLKDMEKELENATRNLNEFGDNNGVAKQKAERFEKATREANEALEAEKKALQDAKEAQKDHEKAVADAKKEVEEFGDKAKEAGEKVGTGILAIATAAGAGAGYALNLSTDFDKAFNTLQTRTGATAEEMEYLNEAMEGVYANNFGDSIEDVAQSMSIVQVNTKASTDEIQNLTERALLLRDTFDFDINESTRSAKMLMDQFGISGEEAYNLIAQGAQAGLDKNGDLLDTINEYSVHFAQLGLSSEDMFNMLVSGAESGTFSVDKLGDTIKEFGIRAKDGSDSSREAFEYLGYDADALFQIFNEGGQEAADMTQIIIDELASMPDSVEKTTAGVALFGTMWEDLGDEGIKALSELDGGISTTSDALEKMNEQKYDDIGSAIQGLGRTLQTDVIEPIGEDLKPVVEDAISYVQENGPAIKDTLTGVASAIGDMVGWLVDNGDVVLATIVGIGTGLLVWNVASMISGVVSAIKAYQLANEGATVAQALFNAVMNANPIVLIVTLIATLVAGIVTFIATNDEARAKFVEIWEKIKEVAGNVVEAVVGFFKGVVDFFKNNWHTILLFVVNPFAGAFKLLYDKCEGFREFIDNLISNIKDFFSNLGTSISTGASDLWTKITGIFDSVVSFFKDNWQTILLFLINPFAGAFKVLYDKCEGFRNFVDGVVTAVKDFFINLGTTIVEKAVSFWNKIVEIFTPVVEWFTSLFSSIRDTLSSIIEVIVVLVSGCWEIIKKVFEVVSTWFEENVITPVKEFFTELWTTISTLASEAWNKIKEIFAVVSTWFTDNVITPVKEFFTELWEFIKTEATNAWNGIVSVWNIVSGWFNDNIISPVKNFFTELWEAIPVLASNAWNGIVNIWNVVSGWFRDKIVTPVTDFFSDMWNKLKTGASNAWSGIKSVFSKVATFFKDTFQKAWQKVKDVFSTGGKIFDGIKEGIASAFTNTVNKIIRGINKVVAIPFGAINKALDKIREVNIMGLSPFSALPSISVPKIPELALGGILKKGQIGLLEGDGAEAVVPLEKNTEWTRNVARQMSDYQNQQNEATNTALLGKLNDIYNRLDKLNQSIVLDTGVLVGETINQIDSRLAVNYNLRARGV